MRLLALASLTLSFAAGVATLYLILAGSWTLVLASHAGGLALGGLGLAVWLREAACNQRGLLGLTLSMMALIPGFSMVAVPLAAAYGSRDPKLEEEDGTVTVEVPRLPFKPLAFDQSLSFSRGGLFEVLERSSDTDKQVVAVMATTRMKAKQAVPLLKVAMRDEADDVRLLAYSIKDKKESEINSKIKQLLSVLEGDDGGQTGEAGTPVSARERAATERSLAFLYWELVYLDLAEGDIRDFYLNQVVTRAKASLAVTTYGPLIVLLARAYMAQEDFCSAEEALDAAEEAGVESMGLAPYRAEVAFHRGRFAEVRERLLEAGHSPHEALREVLDYWLKAA